jgi:hypothetical protein
VNANIWISSTRQIIQHIEMPSFSVGKLNAINNAAKKVIYNLSENIFECTIDESTYKYKQPHC